MLDWKRWLAVRQAAMCVGLTMWAAACGGGGDGGTAPTPPAVATVAVTLAQPSIVVGSSTTATAVLRDAGGATLSNRTVVWTSSNSAIATVTNAGVVSTLAAGDVVISATSEGRTGTASLAVLPPPVANVTVSLAQNRVIAGGSTNATAVLTDGSGATLTGRAITWSSGNTSMATVNAAGTVTAVAAGTVVITATSEGRSGSAQLTIDPPPVATVAVAITPSTVVVGSNTAAAAILRDASGATLSNRPIAWTSSNPSIASVSDAGIISTLSVGDVTISATSEGRVGSAQLSVIPPPVATVSVSLSQPVLLVNASTNATAVLRDANGNVLTNRSIAWSSSSSAVASVSAAGVVTALAAGTTMITATSEGRTGSAMLTVQLPPVATVTVSGASRVKVGDTYNYSATLRLGDGSIVNRPITWDITDPTRASITQAGVLTATRPGSFTIRLTVDGVEWTSNYTAYDWEALSGSGSLFAVLPADNTITNRIGTTNYSELIVSCGSGFFFVWVRTPHVITASGQVALSFDGGSPFSQTWDELSPNFTSLWKPGSNATIKAFAFDIERLSLFGFAFSEFLGSAKAMFFRVRGLGPLLTPIVAACPSNAITASADMIATDVSSQRRMLESLRPMSGAGTSAAAAMRSRPSGPVAAQVAGFAELVDSMTALPRVHSQAAQRRR